MGKITLKLPGMYGDHHVVKVRRVVTALPGVIDISASAALQQIVVAFDPAQLSAEAITSALLCSDTSLCIACPTDRPLSGGRRPSAAAAGWQA